MKKFSWVFFVLLLLGNISCKYFPGEEEKSEPEVKNIIFMIGDGMGVAHIYAAMEWSDSELNMEKAEYAGLCKTHSLSSKITDSAAGGTALATGKKTANGVIAQDTSGTILKTILEYAESSGMSSGLISTSSITHATPASFIAHEHSRSRHEEIASDFLDTDIDVFIGGGYQFFNKREDGLNLVDSLLINGYEVDTTIEQVVNSRADKLAGLLADNSLPPAAKGRGDMLPDATKKALEILSKNKKGFFLMVEGSQIDWGAHRNDIGYVTTETIDFDRALGIALEFAEQNPGTLIVVTADHETGGLTLLSGDKTKAMSGANFSTGGHTSSMVPVLSWGPGAERFSGILDNTDFFPEFMDLLGLEK